MFTGLIVGVFLVTRRAFKFHQLKLSERNSGYFIGLKVGSTTGTGLVYVKPRLNTSGAKHLLAILAANSFPDNILAN